MASASELDAIRYLEGFKALLRGRGVTYAQLAEGLELSLPTVKRALNKPSLPLNRLFEMCAVAGIALEELHAAAEQRRPSHFVFSGEQDRVFAERPEIFAYFLELTTERRTPIEIAERYQLDHGSTELYLEALARLGLVDWRGGSRVRLLVRPPFGFSPSSRVLLSKHRRFMESIVSSVLGKKDADSVAVLKPLSLMEEDYMQMVDEVVNVIHRFSAVSERQIGKGAKRMWQVAVAAGPAPEPTAPSIPRLT